MTDEWQIAGCVGKEAFRDPQSARKVICRIKRNAKNKHRRVPKGYVGREAYRCRNCGQWHIGHSGDA